MTCAKDLRVRNRAGKANAKVQGPESGEKLCFGHRSKRFGATVILVFYA